MISFILTVYNKEKYILKTLKSLDKCLNENYEVIIVNDGSADKSSRIIEDFLKKSKNKQFYKFINRECNKGVSYTKNEGIINANGEFVTFVDGDDLVNYNYYKKIGGINLDKNYIYVSNIIEFSGDAINNIQINNNLFYEDNFNNYIINLLKFDNQNSLCNKIYYKENLIKCFESLDMDMDYAEDLFINLEYVKYIKGIKIIDDTSTYYRKGIISLTSQNNNNQFERIAKNTFEIRNEFIKKNYLFKYKYLPVGIYIEMCYSILKNNNFRKEDKIAYIQKILAELKEYNKILIFIYISLKNKYRYLYIYLSKYINK